MMNHSHVFLALVIALFKCGFSFSYNFRFPKESRMAQIERPLRIKECFRLKASDTEGDIQKRITKPRGFGKPKPSPPMTEIKDAESAFAYEIPSELSADDAIEKTVASSDRFKRMRAAREAELNLKIQRLKESDDALAADPSVGAVPQVVADRMITRIATFFGIPVFGGLSLFVIFFIVRQQLDIVVPPTIVAYATQLPFVLGLIGITYGILSSSWEEEDGSALGFEEAKTNLGRIREGLKNTKELAQLREEVEEEKRRLGRK